MIEYEQNDVKQSYKKMWRKDKERTNNNRIWKEKQTIGTYTNIKILDSKENLSKIKIQLSEWENVFANEATDKGVNFKITKQLMEFNIKATIQSKTEWKT